MFPVFIAKVKIPNLFESNVSFLDGLELVYEMVKGVEKYGDYSDLWYPLTLKGSVTEGDFNLEFRCSEQKYE